MTWKAANATGFDRFIVERSNDGRNFTEAGNVKWNGNSNYSFTDNVAASGIVYYRLKLVDRDNSFRYSQVIALRGINNALDVKAIRNNNSLLVNYHLSGNEANIQVTDMSGKVLYKNRIRGNCGYLNIVLPSAKQLLVVTIQAGNSIVSKSVF